MLFKKDPNKHKKEANNLAQRFIYDYTLQEQNDIIQILITTIIKHRKQLIEANQQHLQELQNIILQNT